MGVGADGDLCSQLTLAQWVRRKNWSELAPLVAEQLPPLLTASGAEVDDLTAIGWLDEAAWFAGIGHLPANLLLFVKSFCVRRAWFALQPSLLQQGWATDVGLIRVCLRPAKSPLNCLPAVDSALAAIYDDLDYLAGMTLEHVDEQIRTFWAKYAAYQQGGEAYACLGATPSDDWPTVVRKYRLLASKYHPDKGGDVDRFRAVQAAFEQLRTLRAHP